MKRDRSYNVVLAGLLAAIGILLPFVTAHAFSMPGTVLLPMHLPIFLIGMLCGPNYGALGGLAVPLLSSVLTGMPVAFPMLPIMMGELFTYGLVSGLIYRRFKLPIYPSLFIAMVCGRIVYGIIYAVLFTVNNGTLRATSVVTAFIQGIPGIITQLILIPSVVTMIKRYGRRTVSSTPESDVLIGMGRTILEKEKVSCVVIRDGEIIHKADGRGIKPLLDLIAANPELLRGSVVVDKIIGKAAAMLLVRSGVTSVYGGIMSNSAYTYLEEHGVKADYGTCIDVISNRNGDGMCPMELAVQEIDDPEDAYIVLKETVKKLAGA